MPPAEECPNPECPNKGLLAIDANAVLYLVEGAIKHTQSLFPQLSRTQRLPRVLRELDSYLATIKNFCSTDGSIHISDQVFNEVSLEDRSEIIRKGLVELQNYSRQERRQIHQILLSHFSEQMIISEDEIQALRNLFNDPNVRPQNRDASLIATACHLASNGGRVIVVTGDPDFIHPLNLLMRKGSVTFGDGCSFPTNQIIYRHYFNFVRRLHDCCNMASEIYNDIGNSYINAQLQRLPALRRHDVMSRIVGDLKELIAVHTKALGYKCAVT